MLGGGRRIAEAPPGDLAEEKNTIALIMATLNSANSFYATGIHKPALFPDTPPVPPSEAVDFLNLLLAVLTSAAAHAGHPVMSPTGVASPSRASPALGQNAAAALLQLIFDGPYNIVDTLTALVAPGRKTYIPTPGGASVAMMPSNDMQHEFNALRAGALRALKTIVNLCHEHNNSAADGGKKHLLSLMHAATLRTSLFQYLAHIVCSPTAPEGLRLAATECLFVLCMRCGLDIALWSSLFEPILKAIAVESSAPIRAFSCAILRQYVVAHPEAEVVRSSLPLLTKMLATDESYDVRALFAQSIEAVVAASYQQGDAAVSPLLASIAEVAHTTLDRSIVETRSASFFESGAVTRPQAQDLHEALSRLLHACVLSASAQGGEVAASVFRLFLRGDVALRALGSATSPNTISASSRLLRLLIERSMAHMCADGGKEVACGILGRMVDTTAVGTLVKALMSLDLPTTDQEVVAAPCDDEFVKLHVAAVEITIGIGLLLLFSPVNRQMFLRELQRYPSWTQGLPQRLHHALSSTALDYFSDLLIIDDCGLLVNDPNGVSWDDPAHPSQASVQYVVDAQEMGRRPNVPRVSWRELQHLAASPDPRRGYLAFVLLGYIFFRVFRHEERPSGGRSPTGGNNTSAALGLMPDRSHVPAAHTTHADPENDKGRALRLRAAELEEEVHAAAAADREPLFPNPTSSRGSPRHRLPAKQQPYDLLRSEFDAAFKLATELSQHYHRNVLPLEAPTRLQPKQKLQNPYEISVHSRPTQQRAWTVHAVREGDLFFLFIPLAALNTSVVGAVVAKARRHHVSAKKAFITTPQSQKERRWFLHDLHTVIMPRIIALLQTLQKLLITQGDEHVQVAASVLPSIRTPSGDKALYGGNVISVVDYLAHYFSLNVGAAAARADREVVVDPVTNLANEILGSPRRGSRLETATGRQASLGRQLFDVSSSSSSPLGSSRSSGSSDLEDRY